MKNTHNYRRKIKRKKNRDISGDLEERSLKVTSVTNLLVFLCVSRDLLAIADFLVHIGLHAYIHVTTLQPPAMGSIIYVYTPTLFHL